MREPTWSSSFAPSGRARHTGHDDVLDRGGDADGLELLRNAIGAVLPLDETKILQGLDELLDEEGDAFRLFEDHFFESAFDILSTEDVIDHGEALAVGEAVEEYLVVVGAGTPGGDILGAVGEDDQHGCTRDAFEEILEDIFRGLVDPVEILDGDDEGTHL